MFLSSRMSGLVRNPISQTLPGRALHGLAPGRPARGASFPVTVAALTALALTAMCLTSLALPMAAQAQQAAPPSGGMDQFQVEPFGQNDPARSKALEEGRMRRNPGQSKQQYIGMAFGISPDGVVTAEMIETQKALQASRARGSQVGLMLGYDLDADGRLTQDELELAETSARNTSQRAQIRMMRMGSDENGDGALDLAELYAYAAKSARKPVFGGFQNRYEMLMYMDGNGDGQVTIQEISDHIDKVAATAPPVRSSARNPARSPARQGSAGNGKTRLGQPELAKPEE